MDPRNWVYFRPVLDTWTIRRTLLSCLPKVTNLWFPWRLFVMQWVKFTVRHISYSARLPFIKIWNGLSLFFFHRNLYKIEFFNLHAYKIWQKKFCMHSLILWHLNIFKSCSCFKKITFKWEFNPWHICKN